MEKEDQRNFLLAMVLLIVFMFGYQKFFMEPAQKKLEAQQAAAEAAGQTNGLESNIPAIAQKKPVEQALLESDRVTIDAAAVDGSIRLAGSRIDDLNLKKHYLTVEKSQEVRLLRPEEADNSFFATWYWAQGSKLIAGANSAWQQVDGGRLTTTTPINLRLTTSGGITINRKISVDENYLFTFEDTLENGSGEPVSLSAVGTIERHGDWKEFLEATDPGSAAQTGISHVGMIGVLENNLRMQKYKAAFKLKKFKGEGKAGVFQSDEGGWFGMTDKYWMSALVPQQDTNFKALVNKTALANGGPLQVRTQSDPITLDVGESVTVTNRVFAGAKRYEVLKAYEQDEGIPRMVDAIDWGWAFFLTKPFFLALEWLSGVVGSFGMAILALTVLVKLPLVPLYNQSYKSMAKMKKLQEPMQELRERFKSDPQRQQQEIMKLYKQEGANPLGGCLPILATIPIFYALYKTLYVTLEMRHTPFLFMKDLSAPDPTAIGNLFGLIPWWSAVDVKTIPVIGIIIGIGILPLLYGITMAGIQTLSPPPPDPTQRKMMMLLPIVFMFIFGGFAGGLVMYWVWSNILSFAQQYFIMKRNGVEPELFKTLGKLFSGKAKKAAD